MQGKNDEKTFISYITSPVINRNIILVLLL